MRRGARLSYSIAGRVSRADITPRVDPLVLTPAAGIRALPIPLTTIVGGVSIAPYTFVASPFAAPLPVEDERDVYAVGGELFPTDRLGFRIGLARAEGEFLEDETYDLAATWFFSRGVAVEFALTRTESEIGALERNSDSANVRFFGTL